VIPRRALLVAVLAPLAAAGSAHAAPVRGTPFTITTPRGAVPVAVRSAVATGLRKVHAYEARRMSVVVRQATEVRVVPGTRCDDRIPFLGQQVGGVTTSAHLSCLFTGAAAWPKPAGFQQYVAAHESVHVLEGELGCNRAPYWFQEGMAEVVSWRATLLAGVGEQKLRDASEGWAARAGLSPGGLRPREASTRGLSYPEAGRAVAEADGGQPTRLVRFCRAVGAGTPWPKAFGTAFGVGINTFYERFSRVRARIMDEAS
jgi:hypothetical protein